MTDRRQRKSKAALQRALLELIGEKPYDAITVDEIAAAADVARATFYAHYKDKAALLEEATADLLRELSERVALVAPQEEPFFGGAGLRAVFAHAAEHRDLYRLLLTGESGPEARRSFVEVFRTAAEGVFGRIGAAQGRKPRVPMPALVTAFVGAILLTLEAWVLDELEGDPSDRIRALV